MRTHTIGILLSLALAVSAPVFAQGDQAGAALPTEAQLVQAAADQASGKVPGALDGLIAEALGQNPDEDRIKAIQALLDSLVKDNPALAAQAAASVAKAATQLAKTSPEAAVALARAATEVLANPDVIAEAPSETGAALIVLGTALNAMKSVAGIDGLITEAKGLAQNPTLAAATQGLADQVDTALGTIIPAAGTPEQAAAPFAALTDAPDAVVIPTDQQVEVSPTR